MKKGPESKEIIEAIIAVSKASKNKNIWKDVKKKLLITRRNRDSVNISRISKYVAQGKTAVVAGKVLGTGVMDHKVDVIALSFSESAKQKITKSGGKTILLSEISEKETDKELVLIR
ncbi:50S ribosomal protein L18e [Candidatus Micrarchaeota archaeon]|jgi:large subunit ribosomal protein L18e|nr:50S ribosomal protein L18e [Candidatus Micrarchaeota archaeon]